MNTRHITRFTYEFTNFQGWRVAINRQGISLARYFSDKQYGGSENALSQAIRFRDEVLGELNLHPNRTQEILASYRSQEKKLYPAGLKPSTGSKTEGEPNTMACSMRSNKVLHNVLQQLCNKLKLDTASVLKLSLYFFAVQHGTSSEAKTEPPGMPRIETVDDSTPEQEHAHTLYEIINNLELIGRQVGMPGFEEFATGHAPSTEPLPTVPPPASPPTAPQTAEHNTSPPQANPPQTSDTTPPPTSDSPVPSTQSPPTLTPATSTHSPHLPVLNHRELIYFPYSTTPPNTRPRALKRNINRDDLNFVPPTGAM